MRYTVCASIYDVSYRAAPTVATTNCPDQYTSKTTCEKKGDCSDGAINRDKVGCATKGLCSDGRQDIKQHLCEFNQTRGPGE
jgi:hypothetical protein